jgi:hypothetical protein
LQNQYYIKDGGDGGGVVVVVGGGGGPYLKPNGRFSQCTTTCGLKILIFQW